MAFWHQLRIGYRIMIGVTLLMVTTVTVICLLVIQQMNDQMESSAERELRGIFENVQAAVAAEGRLAEAMSKLVAGMPILQQAFADGDRDIFNRELVPGFKVLKKEYGARQFQFHTPEAHSFFRVHKPQKFGDDLSSFRKTVVQTNRDKKPIRGLERGVAGLGIRGVVPVAGLDGRHLGSVEFGMSFGKPFFEQFKEIYSVDLGLHLKADGGFKTFASTLGDSAALDETVLAEVLTGGAQIHHEKYNGKPVSLYARVVKDFSGQPVGVLEIMRDDTELEAAIARDRNGIILIGVLATIAGVIISMLLARNIANPLCDAALALEDIADGDGNLTHRLEASTGGEVGRLSKAFNRFIGKIHDLVVDVASASAQVATSAEEMSAITGTMRDSVTQQQSETTQVATAINEMTSTVQEVASHAGDAAESARQAHGAAVSGQDVVRANMLAINTLSDEIGHSATAINELEQESINIGKVLDVIVDIAEQTNLLALNAAIEAARAGEQGRGFAVVADEVRTLAARTQESTEEIKGIIEGLQRRSQTAAQTMNQGLEQVSLSVEQAQKAEAALQSITSAVSAISDMNTRIASAAEEQSAVTEEINRNITNINSAAEHATHSAEQTASSSDELASLALRLQKLVSQFKTAA